MDLELGNIDFKAIFAPENSNKFQKSKFWKEKSIEDVVKFGPMAHATLVWYELHNLKKSGEF